MGLPQTYSTKIGVESDTFCLLNQVLYNTVPLSYCCLYVLVQKQQLFFLQGKTSFPESAVTAQHFPFLVAKQPIVFYGQKKVPIVD